MPMLITFSEASTDMRSTSDENMLLCTHTVNPLHEHDKYSRVCNQFLLRNYELRICKMKRHNVFLLPLQLLILLDILPRPNNLQPRIHRPMRSPLSDPELAFHPILLHATPDTLVLHVSLLIRPNSLL